MNDPEIFARNAASVRCISTPRQPLIPNVVDLAAGASARPVAMSDLPPCAMGFGSYERWLSEMMKGGASVGDTIFAYEIAARCTHGFRVSVRVYIDEPQPLEIAVRDLTHRMRRKHGLPRL